MFCPKCRSEYRSGFTACADCNVPLVEELPAAASARPAPTARRPAGPMLDFCGFFTLEEAREAREAARRHGIVGEIAIRDAPDANPDGPLREEYWLRFAASDLAAVQAALGFDDGEAEIAGPYDETRSCPSCSRPLASGETFCAHCGARFDERRG